MAAASEGVMDYGSDRYKITGGSDDGHEFHAGEVLEVHYQGRWLSARIEHGSGRWLFHWSVDQGYPNDVLGLPVRLARG